MSYLLDCGALASRTLVPLLTDAAVKATVVFAAAWLVTVVLRRAAAAVRHLVWVLALAGAVVWPVLSAALPARTVAVPVPWAEPSRHVHALAPLPSPTTLAELPGGGDPRMDPMSRQRTGAPQDDTIAPPVPEVKEAPAPRVVASRVIPVRIWLVAAWLAGALLVAGPVAVGLLSLRRLRRSSRVLARGRLPALLQRLATQLGLQRPVVLMQSARRAMPMTWGWRQPIILLPAGADTWSPGCLRVVLLHELAHVRRWDCLVQLFAHLVRALYWFHPLAWLAVACLRVEQEQACDDTVLRAGGGDPADYAEHLLTVTSGVPSSRFLSPVALAMGRARKMQRRLEAILDPARSRRPLTGRAVVVVALVALGLLSPLASLRLQTRAARPTPRAAGDEPAPAGVTDETRAQLRRLAEVRAKILQRYVKSISDQEVTDGAIQGMMAALHDPYSEYLAPERVAALEKELGGTLSGIGVQVHMKDGRLTVVTPLEDSPALKAGLRPGDEVLAIDDRPTRGLDIQEAVQRVLGPEGRLIKLKIRHPDGDELTVTFPRAHIQVRSVQGFRREGDGRWQYLIDPDQGIGYVHISRFTATTVEHLRDALGSLREDGVKGLILDLRCCPGGLLRAAVDTTRLFLSHGTIVSVRSPGQVEQSWEADGNSLVDGVPLVVLLNENTASAAEVVAGALKDNGRAVLVGTRSYGKGAVQEVIKLEQGRGALRLTTAYYHLPDGRNIHKQPGAATWGVDPTDGYYVPLNNTQSDAYFERCQQRMALGNANDLPPLEKKLTPERLHRDYADPQLAAAVQTLTARLTTGKFAKVGKSNADLLAHLGRRQEMERRRDELRKSLEQVERELAELEGTKN